MQIKILLGQLEMYFKTVLGQSCWANEMNKTQNSKALLGLWEKQADYN